VALDHNFPTPLLALLGEAMPEVRLLPIRDIDPRLAEFDEDAMIVALHQLESGCLVTTDRRLHDPVTLVAIEQTRSTVGVIEGVGDDPVRAVGTLLLGLLPALRKRAAHKPQIFRLRPRAPAPERPGRYLARVPEHRDTSLEDLRSRHWRARAELHQPLL
jgi:hypothetical protein